MTALLDVRDLSVRFAMPRPSLFAPRPHLEAVRQVSFTLERGEALGIVGESGSGKTTTAMAAIRLVNAAGGQVLFDGEDLLGLDEKAMRARRRDIQLIFQDPYSSLDPRYTLSDVLSEPFAVHGEAPPPGRIAALLDQVGLARDMGGSYPHQLSGGQRQRAGIARALARSPELIVLDEPTASLDVSIQAQVIDLLSSLRRDLGLTYLFISHDLGLVRYFCDRIVVMYLGAVVEVMPAAGSMPRHPYTRALIDSTFAPDPGKRRKLEALTGEIPSAFNLPPGCAFAARCPRASERCRREAPDLQSPDGHAVACFHPIEEGASA